MISANELRIGNWVNQRNRKYVGKSLYPFKVRIQDLKYLEGKTTFKERTEGIPLTPEILEKAGFEKVREESCEIDLDHFRISYDGQTFLLYDNDFGPGSGVLLFHIKYLHQLQNLYFALTGQELNIEL